METALEYEARPRRERCAFQVKGPGEFPSTVKGAKMTEF